jgi:hypothetical protein
MALFDAFPIFTHSTVHINSNKINLWIINSHLRNFFFPSTTLYLREINSDFSRKNREKFNAVPPVQLLRTI